MINGLVSRNPSISGDHEFFSIVNEWLQSLDMNAMTLLAADGDVINDICSQCLERLHKDRRGGLTVHIEVAPDADHFIAANCGADHLYRFFNSRERGGG